MKMRALVYCLLFLTGISYSQSPDEFSKNPPTLPDLYFNTWIKLDKLLSKSPKDSLARVRPIDYLRYLVTFQFDSDYELMVRSRNDSKQIPRFMQWKYTFTNAWVAKEDVDTLMRYVYSKQEAKIPWPVTSSYVPDKPSTVGIEAMQLIAIYRSKDFYYPSLCSTYYFCKPENQDDMAAEYVSWWIRTLNESSGSQ